MPGSVALLLERRASHMLFAADDAVHVHRLRRETEGACGGALDVERIGDAVALVAPARDEAFLGELLDDGWQRFGF